MDSKRQSCLDQYMRAESEKIQIRLKSMHELEMLNLEKRLTSFIDSINKSTKLGGAIVNVGHEKPTEDEIKFIEGYFSLHVKQIQECLDGDICSYKIHFSTVDEMQSIIDALTYRLSLLRASYFD